MEARSIWYVHARNILHVMKEPILQRGTGKMIPRHVFHKPFTVRFPDRSEWEGGSIPIKKGGLIKYTDGSKTNKGTGAGVCGYGLKQKFSFSLGQ
jgi:hypothetical protein